MFTRLSLRRWRPLTGVAATMIVEVALNIVKPWPLAILVDNLQNGKRPDDTILGFLPGSLSQSALINWAVAATILIFIADWAVTLLGEYARIGFGQRLVYDLAEALFDHLQRLSLQFHSRRGVGDSIRRITSDCGSASTIVVDAMLPVVAALLTLFGIVAVMWRIDAELAVVALLVIPFLALAIGRYARTMSDRGYELEQAESGLYDHVERTLTGVAVVQAFNREDDAVQQMRIASDDALAAAVRETDTQIRFKIATGLVMALGTAAVIWIGARHALHGDLSSGAVILFVSYLYELYQPLESLMYTSSTAQGAAGRARRVLEVLEADPEVVDRPGARALGVVRGDVVLEGVSFGYEPGRLVLRGVDLSASAGEVVAIVGATGAGKSTLVSLVPRFFDPSGGRVLVAGQDVRDVEGRSLRRQVSVVLQESFLFPMSIAENIA
jgi:ATP-binding cassette, subfamily B, bacterial